MFRQPILTHDTEVLGDGAVFKADLDLASVQSCIALEVLLDYTTDGAATVHEDGWGALIKTVKLDPSGEDDPIDLDGFSAILMAELINGGPLSIETFPDPSGAGAQQARIVLPLWPCSRDALSPLAAFFDPRELAEYPLRVVFRQLADVVTGANLSGISLTVNVTEYLMAAIQPNPNKPGQFVTASERASVGTTPYTLDLMVGGSLRRLLLIARDDAPVAGARSDDLIDTVEVVVNGTSRIIQATKWRTLIQAAQSVNDYQLPDGCALLTADILGLTSPESFIPLGGAALRSVRLKVTPLADCHLTVVRDVWKVL